MIYVYFYEQTKTSGYLKSCLMTLKGSVFEWRDSCLESTSGMKCSEAV